MAEALLGIQAPRESVCGRSLLREKRDVAYSQGLSGSQIDSRGRRGSYCIPKKECVS